MTPEMIAELRCRHAALTPFALRFLGNGPGIDPYIALACEDGTPLPEPAFDAVLLFAELAAAELPALLDVADERDALADELSDLREYVATIDQRRDELAAEREAFGLRGDLLARDLGAAVVRADRAAAERDALRAKVERVRALHSPMCHKHSDPWGPEHTDPSCFEHCFECMQDGPCPTIIALDEEAQP